MVSEKDVKSWHMTTGFCLQDRRKSLCHLDGDRDGGCASWSRKTHQVHVLVARLVQKRSGGGNTGEQLTEKVAPELTNNFIKNVCVPDVRCNQAFLGEMSGRTAPEARAWESVRSGPVNVH
jgi:hypothetical protein